jgi:hypothetical protein
VGAGGKLLFENPTKKAKEGSVLTLESRFLTEAGTKLLEKRVGLIAITTDWLMRFYV